MINIDSYLESKWEGKSTTDSRYSKYWWNIKSSKWTRQYPSQRKEVNLEDYEKVAALGQILKDLDFPANKGKIINFVKTYASNKILLDKLEKIEDKEYKNVAEVSYEAGLVY